MSFAKDFAAHIDQRRAALMARRVEIIEEVYAIYFHDGQQVFDVSLVNGVRLGLLRMEEAAILSEVANIDERKAAYHEREKEQARIKRREQRARRPKPVRYTPSPIALPSMLPSAEIGCSLGGAEPPWQWTWGLGFVAFSDMLPIPHFHSFA